ncbi:hypothetical protein SCALM49S_01352 [Streptomyces californicus]
MWDGEISPDFPEDVYTVPVMGTYKRKVVTIDTQTSVKTITTVEMVNIPVKELADKQKEVTSESYRISSKPERLSKVEEMPDRSAEMSRSARKASAKRWDTRRHSKPPSWPQSHRSTSIPLTHWKDWRAFTPYGSSS